MNEFSYTIDGTENGAVTLKVGETVTLNFTNAGAILHDAHFGSDPNLTDRLYNNIVASFDMLVVEQNARGGGTSSGVTSPIVVSSLDVKRQQRG